MSLQPCTVDRASTVRCAKPTDARFVLGSEQAGINADLTGAFVRARVLGAQVDVAWRVRADDGTATIASVDPHGVTVRHVYEGGAGAVAGVVLGPRCRASGTVGGGYVVRTDGPPSESVDQPGSLPSALRPYRGRGPNCV